MSENNQEPTMEEILASIRRIISEDDAPADGETEAEVEAKPAAAPAPEPAVFSARDEEAEHEHPLQYVGVGPEMEQEDDVLELTDRIDDPLDSVEALEMSDLEVVAPSPAAKTGYAPLADDEHLVSDPVASEAAYAFGALERSLLMPADGRTLEDVVRELLRPMLKAWLDEHLPSIVETQVQAEVARIARQRR